MKASRRAIAQRSVAALNTLRGRPPRTDYGLLLVVPFLAAAGGALVALAVDSAVDRRRAPRDTNLDRPTKAYSASDA